MRVHQSVEAQQGEEDVELALRALLPVQQERRHPLALVEAVAEASDRAGEACGTGLFDEAGTAREGGPGEPGLARGERDRVQIRAALESFEKKRQERYVSFVVPAKVSFCLSIHPLSPLPLSSMQPALSPPFSTLIKLLGSLTHCSIDASQNAYSPISVSPSGSVRLSTAQQL